MSAGNRGNPPTCLEMCLLEPETIRLLAGLKLRLEKGVAK